MSIEAELLPQGPKFASNIARFGEEPEKLTEMLPEPDNAILMSGLLDQFPILPKVSLAPFSALSHWKPLHPPQSHNCSLPQCWRMH